MKTNRFNWIYFHFLSKYLQKELVGERIVSLKFSKNNGLIKFRDKRYMLYFGEYLGFFAIDEDFAGCMEYAFTNLVDDFEVVELKQLYLDRIIEMRLRKSDDFKQIERFLTIMFMGKLSVIIRDGKNRILYSNDLKFPVGKQFDVVNRLAVYKNISNNREYCGRSITELMKNIESGIYSSGVFCIRGEDQFINKIDEYEVDLLLYLGIDVNFPDFLNDCKRKIISLEIKKCRRKIKAYLGKLLYRKEKILNDLDKRIKIDENIYIKTGEAIIYNKSRIKRGMTRVNLPFYDENGVSESTVELKENLSPEENANYYFHKAEKIRKKRERAIKQMEKIKMEIREIEFEIEHLPDSSTVLVEKWKSYYAKAKNIHEKHFKYYLLESGAHVFVGRNDKENDQLTLHFAGRYDLFFHVREATGSHVILRSDGGKHLQKDIESAASIAAYHSKMRNSKIVPVSYTEIRYVRKPRKAKSGAVVLSKERVIFVSPSIPSS